MKKRDIEEIFKDNIQIELKDGEKLIGPGPCPLSISDWINFLTSMWTTYDKGLAQLKTWMYTSVLLYFASGTFILSIIVNVIKIEETVSLLGAGVIIYSVVFIGSWVTVEMFGKLMDHQGKGRDSIYLIINSIIWGTARDTDLIRDIYDVIVKELHFEARKIIKELKLDKK